MRIEQQLTDAIKRVALTGKAAKVSEDIIIAVSTPEREGHGDFASSIALQLAKPLNQPPMEIAKVIAERLIDDEDIKDLIKRVDVALPGFLNITLTDDFYVAEALRILELGDAYGNNTTGRKRKVQVEFISANPTGPLTLANGRGGFLGDTIARVFTASGYDVTREYYVNDAGEQIKKLGASVMAKWGMETPYDEEEYYAGDYVADIAKNLEGMKPEGDPPDGFLENVSREASKLMLADIKHVVTKIARIPMDVWYSEKSLTRHATTEVIKELQRKNLVEERDGALWLKLSALRGERDKDKVVVKSNGEPAYILPDIAYHYDKFVDRKFTRVVDIFGSDHQDHARVLATSLKALGLPVPEFVLMQFVRLIEDGVEVKMSKRAGTFVTLTELLDEIGSDVARWFFIERTPNTHMVFDLSLAKDTSDKNPVFYVQYAHARCSSILRKAEEEGREEDSVSITLSHPAERALVRTLAQLPELIVRVAESLEVHSLTTYATDVAKVFSTFYHECPVLTDDKEQTASRLALVRATKTVLAKTLGLMGIRAPEKM